MNSNIGGVILPKTTGFSIGWGGSGGTGGYVFTNDPTDYSTASKTDYVNVSRHSFARAQEMPNPLQKEKDVLRAGLMTTPAFGLFGMAGAMMFSEAGGAISSVDAGKQWGAMGAWLVKQFSKDAITDRDYFKKTLPDSVYEYFHSKTIVIDPHMAEDIGMEPGETRIITKKADGGFGNGLTGLFFSTVAAIGIGAISNGVKNIISGKDFDFWGELKKAGVKQTPTIVVSLAVLATFVGADGKRQTDLAKAINIKIFGGKGISNLIKESAEYKNALKNLPEGGLITKNINKLRMAKVEQEMLERIAWAKGSGNAGKAFTGFLKSTGCEMAIGFGVTAITSMAANVLTSWLIDGKPFSEAIKDSKWGEEILKAAVTTVLSKGFEAIFSCIGLGALGKVIGSALAAWVNTWVCEPFRGPNGEIDQGWCAATGCAIVATSILAGAIATAALASCTGPIGWIVGLIIIAAAIVTYCVMVAIHWVVENWEAITGFFEDVGEAIVQFFDDAGQFISDAWEGTKEIVTEIAESTECKVVVNILFFGVPALLGYC